MVSQISAAFDGLRRGLRRTSERFIAANLPDRFYARYKESLVTELKDLSIPGREEPFELEGIYCPLRLHRHTPEGTEEAAVESAAGAPAEARSWQAPMEVTRALLQSSRLVILGGPGSGKTMLLRYLALVFAQDKMSSEYVRRLTFAHQDASMDHVIPILVRLPDFAESSQEMLPYLVDLFADHGFPY